MSAEYQRGQRNALNAAMMALCPHCLTLSCSRDGTNDPIRDGAWKQSEPSTAVHMIDGRPRVCRAKKLIPLRTVMDAVWK